MPSLLPLVLRGAALAATAPSVMYVQDYVIEPPGQPPLPTTPHDCRRQHPAAFVLREKFIRFERDWFTSKPPVWYPGWGLEVGGPLQQTGSKGTFARLRSKGAVSLDCTPFAAELDCHHPAPLKTDDSGGSADDGSRGIRTSMLRWLGMFNENNPSNIAGQDFRKQTQFANLFFHWNMSVLLQTLKYLPRGHSPGLFLSIQNVGVWQVPALKWRNQNATGLTPNWRHALQNVLARVAPYLRAGKISGIFLGDELATKGVPVTNISSVARLIKQTVGDGLVYLNEGTGPFDPMHPKFAGTFGPKISKDIDLLSIDDYCLLRLDVFNTGWPNCSNPVMEVQRVQKFVATHVLNRMSSHHRLLLVPGLFADENVSRSGTIEKQDQLMVSKLNAYFAWATKDNQRIVGVNCWHWSTYPDRKFDVAAMPFYHGVDQLPLVRQRLRQLSREVSGVW